MSFSVRLSLICMSGLWFVCKYLMLRVIYMLWNFVKIMVFLLCFVGLLFVGFVLVNLEGKLFIIDLVFRCFIVKY